MGPRARRLPAIAASFLASQLGSATEAINFLHCDAFLHVFAQKTSEWARDAQSARQVA